MALTRRELDPYRRVAGVKHPLDLRAWVRGAPHDVETLWLVTTGTAPTQPHETLFGLSVGIPQPTNTPSQLDAYRGITAASGSWPSARENLLPLVLADWRAASGIASDPVAQVFHSYEGVVPSAWSSTVASRDDSRDLHSMQNIRLLDADSDDLVPLLAAGDSGAISALAAYVTSAAAGLANGRILWLVPEHEPEQEVEVGRYTAAQWRAAFAQAAKTILDNRGSADIRPTSCLMRWTWSSGSGRTPADWNPAGELTALGVDLDDVVFGLDGYSQHGSTTSAASILDPPFTSATGWGFSRMAVCETAVKSWWVGTGTTTDLTLAAEKRAVADEWADGLAAACSRWETEVCCWFASGIGGNAGPEGWWPVYSTDLMARLAEFGRDGY